MLVPGALFDRYRVEQVIGEGGMGQVYRAFDTRLCRTVALKVLRPAPGDGDGTLGSARLLREARAAAALVHPNVVAVFDVGEIDGAAFLVMELVEGASLRERMRERAPLGIALRWLVDVARALAAAHRAGLVHRDVKPENVMVRSDGVVKVLDFGIARGPAVDVARAGGEPASTTAPNVILGTLQYMSPEQAHRQPLDGRADQFAWGVLGYELLTGRLPWEQGDAVLTLTQILARDPPPIRAVVPDAPAEVEAVIRRALAKDRDARFATLDEAADLLEPFARPLGAHAIVAPPSYGSGAMAPPSSARDATVPVAITPPSAPTQPGGITTPAAPVPAPPPIAPPAKGSLPRGRILLGAALGVAIGGAAAVAAVGAHRSPPPIPSAATAAPATVVRAITDLPSPRSTSPEALDAYHAALRALRSGVNARGGAELERAVKLDPALAAAHLQLVVLALDNRLDDATRQHFRAAEEHADALTDRDRLLLAALEPGVRRQPAAWRETITRLRAALDRYPEDAELWHVLGSVLVFTDGSHSAIEPLSRAASIDPEFAFALAGLAEQLLYTGRFDDARSRVEQCLRASPSSISCMLQNARLAVQQGACDEVEALGRRIAAVDPEDAYGPQTLSLGVAGRVALPALREVLAQKHARLSAARRAHAELRDAAHVAALAGDFSEAERQARALVKLVEGVRQQAPHGMAARLLAWILLETGRDREAADVAAEFLDKRDAWEPDPRAEDFALAEDATVALLAVQRRAGRLSDAAFDRDRAAWLSGWKAKASPEMRGYLWLHGFGSPAAIVETRAEAERALAALAAHAPLPAFRPFTLTEAGEGVTLALAGKHADAAARLAQATRTCRALDFPIEHTRAHHWLGASREALGDTAGACDAYRVVLDRWGHARPRSVTADRARARVLALRCAR
jgi:serine/threonine-protein kinase